MNTKLLMAAASFFLGASGITLTFFPQEILSLFENQGNPSLVIIMQLLGALYFGFGMLNWLAKDSILGGIYGRPIVVGNMTHFVIGTLALFKVLTHIPGVILLIAAIVYGVFALFFSMVMYKNPTIKDM